MKPSELARELDLAESNDCIDVGRICEHWDLVRLTLRHHDALVAAVKASMKGPGEHNLEELKIIYGRAELLATIERETQS